MEDYRNVIRSKTIPWDGFARSQLIDENDGKILNQLEVGYAHGEILSNFDEESEFEPFVKSLLNLIKKDLPVERNDIKKYSLVALSDFFKFERFVVELVELGLYQEYLNSLVALIENDDEILKLFAIYDVVFLLIQGGLPSNGSSVYPVFKELNSLLENTTTTNKIDLKFLSIDFISELLAKKEYRAIYWEHHDEFLSTLFLNLGSTIYSENSGISKISSADLIQFQYKLLLSLWILTFTTSKNSEFAKVYLNNLLSLVKLLKISIKEKIIRLIISIFINLTSLENSSSQDILKFLILNAEFINILNNLKERKWTDDELIQDLETLSNQTVDVFNKLTSFDEYLTELKLKQFKNSPVHDKEEFFIDNLDKFQDFGYKHYKELLAVLDEDIDGKALKIVLGDINKILKIDSKAIDILIASDKKTKIMELLNHSNSEVRYEALKITQVLVSQSLK